MSEQLFAEYRAVSTPAQCWTLEPPEGRRGQIYRITWIAGMLTIACDGGESLVFQLSHPFRTLDTTLRFLDGIHFDYLMGKSTAKQRYNPEKTFDLFIENAEDDADIENGWYDLWERLAKHLVFGHKVDVTTETGREQVKDELRLALADEHEAATMSYDLDLSLVHEYPEFWMAYFEAIQRWVKLLRQQQSSTVFFRNLQECAFL